MFGLNLDWLPKKEDFGGHDSLMLNIKAWTERPKNRRGHPVCGLGSSWSGSSADGGCGPGLMLDETQCSSTVV